MAHRFSIPTDIELENLITRVFKSLSDADQSRLLIIESRLLQKAKRNKSQKNLNKIPWWIVLILAGSIATAAWWAGDLFIGKQDTEIRDKQPVSNDMIKERRSNVYDAESKSENDRKNNETYEDRDSPVIYQRESF